MKPRNPALTVPTATLLPTLAFANAYGDAIRAAFARDFAHEFAARSPARIEVDAIDVAQKSQLLSRTVDSNSRRVHSTHTVHQFSHMEYLDPSARC